MPCGAGPENREVKVGGGLCGALVGKDEELEGPGDPDICLTGRGARRLVEDLSAR
jgi:hypothetical protein